MNKFRTSAGLLVALCLLLMPYLGLAQRKAASAAKPEKATTGSVLWEVSGNGLTQPSYLFGTFHLLNSEYLKARPTILDRFNQTKAVVGELVFDSTVFAKIAAATLLQGTTLDKLLKPEDYQRVDAQLQQVTPYKLAMLNGISPMAVAALLTSATWQKQHPQGAEAAPMDVFFQQEGRKSGKAVLGLETADEQCDVLFKRIPLNRQAEMLAEAVQTPEKLTTETDQLSQCYQQQDLTCINQLMYDKSYKPEEVDLLVAARTRAWVVPVRKQLATQPTFVAVGAAHLVGKDGLIELLRKAGYTVKPVAM